VKQSGSGKKRAIDSVKAFGSADLEMALAVLGSFCAEVAL
jgi:hypothetical protein